MTEIAHSIPWWAFISMGVLIILLMYAPEIQRRIERRRRRGGPVGGWASMPKAPDRQCVKVCNGVTWINLKRGGWVPLMEVVGRIDEVTEMFKALGKAADAATKAVDELREALDAREGAP